MSWRLLRAWAGHTHTEGGRSVNGDWYMAGEAVVPRVETMPQHEKSGVSSCFLGTVEKYWDLFQHPALGTVYLSSLMHVTPSDTNWTLQALLVPSCIYDECSAHVEAWAGCPARLLGWLCAVIEPLSLPISVPASLMCPGWEQLCHGNSRGPQKAADRE